MYNYNHNEWVELCSAHFPYQAEYLDVVVWLGYNSLNSAYIFLGGIIMKMRNYKQEFVNFIKMMGVTAFFVYGLMAIMVIFG